MKKWKQKEREREREREKERARGRELGSKSDFKNKQFKKSINHQ